MKEATIQVDPNRIQHAVLGKSSHRIAMAGKSNPEKTIRATIKGPSEWARPASSAGPVGLCCPDRSGRFLHPPCMTPLHRPRISSLRDLRGVATSRHPALLGGLIFDFDHTLAQPRTPLAAQWQKGARLAQSYLEAQGLKLFPEFWEQVLEARRFAQQKSEEEEEEHIANDTMSFLLQFCGYPASKMDEQVLNTSVDLFYAPEMTGWELLPGVTDTLAALQAMGLQLAVIANYPCARVFQRTIDYLQLRRYFSAVICSASLEWRKPRPEIFQPVLRQWQLYPYEVAVVGDNLQEDINGGLHLGAMTVHARVTAADAQTTYRNARAEARITPDGTFTAWPELIDLIRPWM